MFRATFKVKKRKISGTTAKQEILASQTSTNNHIGNTLSSRY